MGPVFDTMLPRERFYASNKPCDAWDGVKPFEVWQKETRQKLMDLLLMPQEMPETDGFRIVETRETDENIQTHFTFYTEPDIEMYAVFCSPKNVQGDLPLMICLQGHNSGMHLSLGVFEYPGDEARTNKNELDYALQANRRGFHALVFDQRGFGARGGKDGKPNCRQTALTAIMTGRTLVGERIWDAHRALDVTLAHFGGIDRERIACMGNSSGGTSTMFVAVTDPRVRASIVSCSFAPFADCIGRIYHCDCNYVPHLHQHLDMADICLLAAPNPMVIVNGTEDPIFPIEATKKEFSRLSELYALSGARGRCVHVCPEGEHRFYREPSWAAFLALTGWNS